MKPLSLRFLVPALALAAACDKPGVAPGLDEFNCPDAGPCTTAKSPGVISGSVVYAGAARGDAVLLLFDSEHLPPPEGVATSAVAVARVAEATLFAAAPPGSSGPFSAPFTFTQVPSGRAYQIRAFIDATHEFEPFFDFTQQPRAGDPAGGYGALDANGQPKLLTVQVDPGVTVSGINVALTKTILFDPPSFVLAAPLAFDQTIDQPVHLHLQTVNLNVRSASFARAHFAVELDRDPLTGNRRSTFGDGLDDVFPQVFLRQLTGFPDGKEAPIDPATAAIIPGRVLPTPQLPLLVSQPTGADPLAADALDVLIEPLAVLLQPGGFKLPLPTIPPGSYQVIVVERSGQVWTVPNSLGDTKYLGTDYFAPSQHATVTVESKVVLPTGAISGKVVYAGPSISGTNFNVIVQAYLDDPLNPPPPLGGQKPVRVAVLQPGQILPDTTGFSASYRLPGLAPGKYIVEALADLDRNFSPINLLQTPTRGDLVGAVLDLATLRPASIAVAFGEIGGQQVTLATTVPLDPPAFELDDAAGLAQMHADERGPVRFGLVSKALSFPIAAGSPQTTAFTVSLVRDANGKTVDADGDGLPDVWPRVFLVRLNPTDPTDLTVFRDDQGREQAQVIPAAVDPTPFLPALLAAPGPLLTTRVTVIARPALIDAATHLRVLPAGVAPGKYKVVVINQTGQVWQIPNEANPAALDPRAVCPAAAATCAPGTVQTQSQGRSFAVLNPTSLQPGAISGLLNVTGVASFFGAYVFAYDLANPPPTGTPVSADYHARAEFSAPSSGAPLQVAYTLRGLAPTDGVNPKRYLVVALVDTRGDFAISPQLFAAAPGEGSVPGAHLVNGVPTPVVLTSPVVTDVQVDAYAVSALPPRPSFQLIDPASQLPISAGDVQIFSSNSVTPGRISLQAQPVLGPGVAALPETATSFPVSYDGCTNNVPNDADQDNLPDVYPKIRLVKISPDDPTGLRPDLDASGAVTVIPAVVDPLRFLATLTCGTKVNAPSLDVAISPAAFKVRPDGSLAVQLARIPAGRYQVVLISRTNQVWRIPNELQPQLLDPRALALAPQLATQGVAVSVASSGPQPTGEITGVLHLSGYDPVSAPPGNVLVAAYRTSDPPPLLGGTGRPVATQLLRRGGLGNGPFAYDLQALPAGSYFVAALMDRGNNFNPALLIMASPGKGAQLTAYGGAGPIAVVVGAAAVSGIDLNFDQAATPAVPFERPMFKPDASAGQPSLAPGASTPALLTLLSSTPVGLPYVPGVPAFHPKLFPDGAGGYLKQPSGQWEVTTKVAFTPLSPLQTCAPVGLVNPAPFCAALVTGADLACTSGTPTPALATVTSLSVNVLPTACVRLADGVPLAQRPSPGPYRINVLERLTTGATWSVPNELAAAQTASSAEQGQPFLVQ